MRTSKEYPSARSRAKSGFSLPEVLVAITIGAALIVAALTFAFSMGELWGNGSETRTFDQHVRGVSRFLETMMRNAEPPPEEAKSSVGQQQPTPQEQQTTVASAEPPIVWQKPRGNGYSGDELLTFELPESPGILVWPDQALPFVVCSLRVDPERGLFLLWKSRLEIDFEDESPREFRLSPFVKSISYFYYDDSENNSSWESRDQPETISGNEKEVPVRIRLHFAYHGLERTSDIVLPGLVSGVPLY
jgi:prepilin-type N-terminal cleavage/methylation domain-containing protein